MKVGNRIQKSLIHLFFPAPTEQRILLTTAHGIPSVVVARCGREASTRATADCLAGKIADIDCQLVCVSSVCCVIGPSQVSRHRELLLLLLVVGVVVDARVECVSMTAAAAATNAIRLQVFSNKILIW